MAVPPTYPTLIGLTYSAIKRPKWSTGNAVAASGRSVRVAYWSAPLWEWELTYDYLPDMQASGTTSSDLKTLMGFVNFVSGAQAGFLFPDHDDNTIAGQGVGAGDGATTSFTLVRTLGSATFGAGTEPVGYVDLGAAFNVYLNGVLQGSGYTVDQTTPVNQLLTFTSAPGAGVVVTVDMNYFYYAHFKDDTQDFEKFMNKLWDNKKITLESLRG